MQLLVQSSLLLSVQLFLCTILIRLTWVFGKVSASDIITHKTPQMSNKSDKLLEAQLDGTHKFIYFTFDRSFGCVRECSSRDQKRCHLFASRAAFLRQTMRMQMNAGCKWNAISLCIFHMHISASASALSKLNYKNSSHSIWDSQGAWEHLNI